jgi:ketosteroid isomerase-like protein
MTCAGALDRLADWFEVLDERALAAIGDYYAADAYFKDPFNEVRGAQAIGEIFARMYRQLDAPRFRVRGRVGDDAEAFLLWDLEFRFRGRAATEVIRGVSHLRLDAHGRVAYHRDYWDTAEELYAKIPLLGAAVRWLKRRAG